jgi:SH3-like domain-containing protein
MMAVVSYLLLFLFFIPIPSAALCVKTARANLRASPSRHSTKTWEVYKYMPFREIKRKGAWIKVKDMDGDYHWIYSKLVTSSIKCAVVKSKSANLRTGPGTKYKKKPYISSAQKYSSFKLLKVKGQWLKLKDEFGDTAWIHRKLLWVQ